MSFIDTHCHLDFDAFDHDRDLLISSSISRNVKAFVVPAVSSRNWDGVLRLTEKYPTIWGALGTHPLFFDHFSDPGIEAMVSYLDDSTSRIVAIGEIGIDLVDLAVDEATQTEVFRAHLDMAAQYQLPVILHVRKAHDKVLKLIKDHRFSYGGIIHCYSGSESQAKRYIKYGFKLGIGGVITYDRSYRLQRIIKNNPLSSLVLETDSPDIPIQGSDNQRNTPEMIPEIFTALTKYRPEPVEVIEREIYQSTLSLFPKIKGGKDG